MPMHQDPLLVRGKGGKRDNPDARECRAAYRQVVFDQLLVPSKGSNCSDDLDSVLVSLTSMGSSGSSRSSQPHAAHDNNDKLSGVELLPVITPPASIPVKNIEAYMAGYLLRKSSITDCDQCRDQLFYDEPPDNDVYTFLRAKALQEKGTLFYPTESLIFLVESWETIFNGIFETIVHEKHVLSTLVSNSHHSLVDYLLCTDPKCSQKLNGMLHSYMKIRIHSSLKRSNKANTVSGLKRNRKVLKLMHQ